MRRIVLALLALVLLRADMFQDASNAKLPEARTGLLGAPTAGYGIFGTGSDWARVMVWDAATNNLRLGPNALAAGGVGGLNIALGEDALANCGADCDSTVVLGYKAGESLSGGRASLFLGHVAGQYATAGNSNTFLGAFAGRGGPSAGPNLPLLTGGNNSCIGEAACLHMHGVASSNNALGFNALFGLKQGVGNVAIGVAAGQSLVDATQNVAIGLNSYGWGTGNQNVVIGSGAGRGTWDSGPTAGNDLAGQPVVTVADTAPFTPGNMVFSCCTQIGSTVLSRSAASGAGTITLSANLYADMGNPITVYSITNPHTATGLVAIGFGAAGNVQGSVATTAVGLNALKTLTTGTNNTAFGRESLAAVTTQVGNVGFGSLAGNNVKSANNTFVGSTAGQGSAGTPLTGNNNTGLGQQALFAIQGAAANNTAIGQGAGAALTTAGSTVAIGSSALGAKQTGNNVVAVGANAGANVTTGTNSTLIGGGVAPTLTNGNNNIVIGNLADVAAGNTSNSINIGGVLTASGINVPATSVVTFPGSLVVTAPVRLSAGYTVATLPAAPGIGARAYVTDQATACVAPGAALTGGGAVVCPVFYNGTAWLGG